MRKITALALAVFMALLCLRQEGRAMLVPAEMTAAPGASAPADRQEDLAKIQRALENKMVRQRLSELGLNESEINDRLSKLSDPEVHELASRMDSIIPAGDAAGVIIVILVIAVLTLLVIYLAKRV